jgi:hypothetical protein
MQEYYRRHMLHPDPGGRDPKLFQPEFKQGRRAALKGERRTANPYPKGSLSNELWLLGFLAGWRGKTQATEKNKRHRQ